MELRHFRYFVAVAEELHFGRAARRLHIAQPPLSQQIKWLEQELGVLLFHRTTHRVSLTDAGRVLLKEARRVLVDVERSVRLARQTGEGTAGRMVIGFVSHFDGGVFSVVKPALAEEFPDLEIQLTPMDTMDQIAAIREARIRAGVAAVPIEDEDLEAEPLVRPPLFVALREGHRLSGRTSLRLQDLAGEPFIMFPKSSNPWIVELFHRRCHEAGFEPRVTQESTSPLSMEGFVAAGEGIGILPGWVRSARKGVVYRRLEAEELPVTVALIYLRGQNSPALRRLHRLLKEVLERSAAEQVD